MVDLLGSPYRRYRNQHAGARKTDGELPLCRYGVVQVPRDKQTPENPAYYAARAVEERRLAAAATDPNVREIHLELAEKYAELAGDGGTASPRAANDPLTV